MNYFFSLFFICFVWCFSLGQQSVTPKVNPFLGTAGDHGQMSPAASSPFSVLSIGPETYPQTHIGYDFYAKEFLGFTHTRIEGVGCQGMGGNFLLKPYLSGRKQETLLKESDAASPGSYAIQLTNGINASVSVLNNHGIYSFEFPSPGGFLFDLSHTFNNRFVEATFQTEANMISGRAKTQSTCHRGSNILYFSFEFPDESTINQTGDYTFDIQVPKESFHVGVAISSVNEEYAKKKLQKPFYPAQEAETEWNNLLSRVIVNGTEEDEKLFYSLLYRGLQAPFHISEEDGSYRSIDGEKRYSDHPMYHGWAIWDNYREQTPMLSLLYPDYYDDIARSVANLYPYGKEAWSTDNEPAPSVRTEHAVVVLLDAHNKGVDIDIQKIKPFLVEEMNSLDKSSPDKALETAYDYWAAGQLLKENDPELSADFLQKASIYQEVWEKEFKDLSRDDVDRLGARGLYQGTIWQYRWFVPFDIQGLKELAGGDKEFLAQLDEFFDRNYYNHANQPDLQTSGLYNATPQPWKSQRLIQQLLKEDVIQFYFNNNSRGIDPYIGRIYQNKPKAYLRTMDDDAGTMSSWWVLRSLGFSAANVGEPVLYLNKPLFDSYTIHWPNRKCLNVTVTNNSPSNYYIESVELNGKRLMRNWLTYNEIQEGGQLVIHASDQPNKNFGTNNQWISSLQK